MLGLEKDIQYPNVLGPTDPLVNKFGYAKQVTTITYDHYQVLPNWGISLDLLEGLKNGIHEAGVPQIHQASGSIWTTNWLFLGGTEANKLKIL